MYIPLKDTDMAKEFFVSIENLTDGSQLQLENVLSNLAFNDAGLIPVITQSVDTKEVLMFAWMNDQSLRQTLTTGLMTYWSRSRKSLWVKGETSGHYQHLRTMSFDCDGDAILCLVDHSGPACHTGRPNCFYLEVDQTVQKVSIIGDAK